MSWQDLLQRVLAPVGPVLPHTTSEYGAIRKKGTSPHRGVDGNYNVGPNGQAGINLKHPALRAPVDGIITNAGEGAVGRIAIRDANGLSHEILHTHTQHVSTGDPVVAGQIIGTMGNMGVNTKGIEDGDHHVHFQIKDSAGNPINPAAYWNQQGPLDPKPASPTLIDEHRQYLRRIGEINGNPMLFGSDVAPVSTGGETVPADSGREVPRLTRLPIKKERLGGFDPNAPAPLPNEIPSAGRTASFDDRFGNWSSSSGVSAPVVPHQPVMPSPQAGRPLGLLTGEPMPDYPFPPSIFGSPDGSLAPGGDDWVWGLIRSPQWDKKMR